MVLGGPGLSAGLSPVSPRPAVAGQLEPGRVGSAEGSWACAGLKGRDCRAQVINITILGLCLHPEAKAWFAQSNFQPLPFL